MKTTMWTGTYQARPDGRFRITGRALKSIGIEHPERILDTELWGRPARVLLLDKPLKLGEKAQDGGPDEFVLRRIRLHELPGWPPKMASCANVRKLPLLMDCRLREATYSDGAGPGQEGVEFVLDFESRTHRAWLVGCPIPLLKCVEITLGQDGLVGSKLSDIQDMSLIGAPL